MTVQELKEHCRKTVDSQRAYKNHPDDMEKFFYNKRVLEEHQLILNVIEAWEKVNEDIDRLARRPCINQNMMAQNIAYKEVKDIIKKYLGE